MTTHQEAQRAEALRLAEKLEDMFEIDFDIVFMPAARLLRALSTQPSEQDAPVFDFTALEKAMTLASQLAGAVGMSNVSESRGYSNDLRAHLSQFIGVSAKAAAPLTDEQEEEIWDEMVNTHGFGGDDTRLMVGYVIAATERAHGITTASPHLASSDPEGHRQAIADHEASKQEAQGGQVPRVCDGKEQGAFEEWAVENRYDMSCHPLHWLFLNERANAARQGWKAAINYCAGMWVLAATPKPPQEAQPRNFRSIGWGTFRANGSLIEVVANQVEADRYTHEGEFNAEVFVRDPSCKQEVKGGQEADGWKLVPVEPTTEMSDAGNSAGNGHDWQGADVVYAAMLAATPKPQAEPRPLTADERGVMTRAAKASGRLIATGAQPQAEPTDAERLQGECDQITALNHAQWLALGKAALLVACCNRLSAESEEFDFPDGMGRGVQQTYWDEFESALEQAAEAIDEANKTTQQLHSQPQAEPAPSAAARVAGVWMLSSKTFTALFASKEDADAYQSRAGTATPSLYIDPVFVPIIGSVHPTPDAAAPSAAVKGWKLLKDTTHEERSWAEDSSHENGAYSCCCVECGRMFTGHKRRVVCKHCAAHPTPDAPQKD